MAVLRIQFASEQLCNDENFPRHLLLDGFLQLEACTHNLTGDDSTVPQVQYATVTRLIRRTEHTMICPALLDGTVEVVLKLGISPSSRARIQVEVDHYEARLKPFWGSLVPIYYGLYKGPVQRPSGLCNKISCLMLEYAGEPLKNLVSLPREDKHAIMTMLGQLHSVSVHPEDFAARNVVQKNGAYRLIRFQDPTLHNCEFNGDFEWDEPCSGRLGCSKLETAGVNMIAWDPASDVSDRVLSVMQAGTGYTQSFSMSIYKIHVRHRQFMRVDTRKCDVLSPVVRGYLGISAENDRGEKELKASVKSICSFGT